MRINLIAPWYVHTQLMSDRVFHIIDEQLKKVGSAWATVEDAAKACLRCAADEGVNGKDHSCTWAHSCTTQKTDATS